jgi:hypothetical protein
MKTSTICIGGCAAGQWYTNDQEFFRVAQTPPLSIEKLMAGSSPVLDIRYTSYHRMELRYRRDRHEEAFVFWAADHIHDEYDLLRELSNGYHPVGQNVI